MSYRAIINDNQYLCHFNPNHDKKNGRFTFAKLGNIVKGAAVDVGRGFKGGAKVVNKGLENSGAYDKLKKAGSGLKSVGSEVGRGFKNATKTVANEINSNGKKPPAAFKTPELDEKSKKIAPVIDKMNAMENLPWLVEGINANEKWGKEYVNATDIGLQALKNIGDRDAYYGDKIGNIDRSWFVLEHEKLGMPQVAFLASIGKSNDEIRSIISANGEFGSANNNYLKQFDYRTEKEEYSKAASNTPYKVNAPLYYASTVYNTDAIKDEYINECIKLSNKKEVTHSSMVNCGNYLVHFNKNRSKATGQFISGDGDGDGIVDDHHNQPRTSSQRKASDLSDDELKKLNTRKNLENQYNKLYPSRQKQLAESVSEVSKGLGSLAGGVKQIRLKETKNPRADLSHLSDAQLRTILNREQMERQYDQYFNTPVENKGQKYIDAIGTGLTIAVGVATLASLGIQISGSFGKKGKE